MEKVLLAIGDTIEARCTNCRKNLKHTIISLADEIPAGVECTVCNRQHKFRPPSSLKKQAPKQTVDANAAVRQEWAALRPEMNISKATDYSMDAAYKRGAIMKHPVFGFGLVQDIVGQRKISVLFEDGLKTMRCK